MSKAMTGVGDFVMGTNAKIWNPTVTGGTSNGQTHTNATLSGTTTNSGTISGGTVSGSTLAGTITNTGTVSGGTLSGNTVNNPTMSGGTADNTAIGNTTPGPGAFTTLATSVSATFNAGTYIVNGAAGTQLRFANYASGTLVPPYNNCPNHTYCAWIPITVQGISGTLYLLAIG